MNVVVPDPAVPERPVPERPVPERPVPERPVPERPVPERSVPERSVPELPAPDPAAIPAQTVKVVNIANGLTLLRLLLVPVFGWALLHDHGTDTTWRIVAFVVFAIASATDRLDGDLARRRGLVTDVGKMADPIADKALTGTALVGLSALDLLPWWVTVVILTRELGITLLRFWVIRHGVIPASRGGKYKTFLQTVAIGLYLLPLTDWLATVAAWVMGAALVLTVATGIDYVVRALALRRAAKAPS